MCVCKPRDGRWMKLQFYATARRCLLVIYGERLILANH